MKHKFWFLTKLSFKKKVLTKWFLAAQILMLVVTVGLMNINNIISFFGGDFSDETTIYVVDNVGSFEIFNANFNALNENLTDFNNTQVVNFTGNLAEKKEQIIDTNNFIIIINSDKENFINAEIISEYALGAIMNQVIISSLNSTRSAVALIQMDISVSDLALIYSNIDINLTLLNEDAEEHDNRAIVLNVVSTIVGIPIFIISIYLISMIGAEINEEKSTRSMEIIVSNVSAKVHLFSKLVAVNAFAILQSLLLVVYGAIALFINSQISDSDITGGIGSFLGETWQIMVDSGFASTLWYVIPLTVIMLVVTFICYSLLAGILASMTTNMEDFQQLQTPVIMLSLVGYYLALAAAAFEGAVFIRVASYIPLISAILAPGLMASGYLTVIDFIISLSLLIILSLFLMKFGLRIYKVGILNYSLDKLWTKIFKATKER